MAKFGASADSPFLRVLGNLVQFGFSSCDESSFVRFRSETSVYCFLKSETNKNTKFFFKKLWRIKLESEECSSQLFFRLPVRIKNENFVFAIAAVFLTTPWAIRVPPHESCLLPFLKRKSSSSWQTGKKRPVPLPRMDAPQRKKSSSCKYWQFLVSMKRSKR